MRAHEFEPVSEKVNKEIFTPDWKDRQPILDGKYFIVSTIKYYGKIPNLYIEVYDSSKEPPYNQYPYYVAYARFRIVNRLWWKHLEAGMVSVNEKYRRQGIAAAIYQYVTKLGNTVKPSSIQLPDGKAMWKGFKKKDVLAIEQNVNEAKTTREDFEGTTIEMVKNGHVLVINALDDWGNNVLGSVAFNIGDDNDLDPQDLKVDERYQGQGIARVMYDYAKSKGYEIHRSYDQTDAGAGFWNKHRGEDVRVWEESNSANIVSAKQIWYYISKIHPKDQQGGGFLKSLVMLNPQYELKRVPLSSLHIPNDEDEGNDPYGRAMFVDVYHAEEYSQYEVDKKPLVVDSQGYILDGAHRAWAASELLNKKDIMAYVPVKNRTSTPQDLEIRKKFTNQNVAETFDQPYKGKWEKSEYGDVDLNTKLPDGTNLSIMFNNQQGDEGEEVVQVEFYRNNSQEVTGEGDAQRIFATVLDAIQKYIKKYKPQRLSFSASKQIDMDADDVEHFNPESRAKLYTRLVQRYAGALGYQAQHSDEGDVVIYQLTRAMQENFADGRHPEDKGDSKRYHVPTKSSVSNLRKFAKSHSGRAAQLAHWAANMKAGRAKKK
jgi:GNAT superfamily N-acetyltransferase